MEINSQKTPTWVNLSEHYESVCGKYEPFFYFLYDGIDTEKDYIPAAYNVRITLGKTTRYENDLAFVELMKNFKYNGSFSLHELMMRFLMLYVEFNCLKNLNSSPINHIEKWISYTSIICDNELALVKDWCNHSTHKSGIVHYYTKIWKPARRSIFHSNKGQVRSKSLNDQILISEETQLVQQNTPVNTKSKTQSDHVRHNSNYDISKLSSKIKKLYSFATGNVISPDITEAAFTVAVETANFASIYSNSKTKKSKLKLILKKISSYMDNKYWYQDVTASINSTPSKCSGANPNDEDWADELQRI